MNQRNIRLLRVDYLEKDMFVMNSTMIKQYIKQYVAVH